MRRFFSILVVSLLFVTGLSGAAQAEPKRSIFGWHFEWSPDHWVNQDFEPYVQNARHPHRSQWDDREWRPERWATPEGKLEETVIGFFQADILRDRYMKKGRPVLEVGPNFYRLGFYDQQRVAQMIDAAYGVSREGGQGYFMLHDWNSHKPIGVFDAGGLQLQ